MSKPLIIRWLAVCLIPLATLAVFAVNPPEDAAQHLINGIILACEATFLFKLTLDIEANLGPGSYYVDINLLNHNGTVKYDVMYRAEEFIITNDFSAVEHSFGGLTMIPRKWHTSKK